MVPVSSRTDAFRPPPPQSITNVVVTGVSVPDSLSGLSAEGAISRQGARRCRLVAYGARLLSGLGV